MSAYLGGGLPVLMAGDLNAKHVDWRGTVCTSIPILFSLYVNDMPGPSQHVELALYADDTAIIATSRQPVLLVSYLQ